MDLAVQDLTIEYTSGDYTLRPVDELSFRVPSGSLALLLGPSGCGKSTLLSCLAGILTPSGGTIMAGETDVTALRGKELADYRRATVGIVFQAFNLIPSLSALENVAAPMRVSGQRAGRHARAVELLERVGLADRIRHRPGQLSGGQQQRVAIARAIVGKPIVLLADEPTGNLDSAMGDEVMGILEKLNREGTTIVMVTHDPQKAEQTHRIVRLFDGRQVQ